MPSFIVSLHRALEVMDAIEGHQNNDPAVHDYHFGDADPPDMRAIIHSVQALYENNTTNALINDLAAAAGVDRPAVISTVDRVHFNVEANTSRVLAVWAFDSRRLATRMAENLTEAQLATGSDHASTAGASFGEYVYRVLGVELNRADFQVALDTPPAHEVQIDQLVERLAPDNDDGDDFQHNPYGQLVDPDGTVEGQPAGHDFTDEELADAVRLGMDAQDVMEARDRGITLDQLDASRRGAPPGPSGPDLGPGRGAGGGEEGR